MLTNDRIRLYRKLRAEYGFTAIKAWFYATGRLVVRGSFH
jgi:hypothetical protein